MTIYVRTNAWDNGGNFKDARGNHTELYWYAIGVHKMQQRTLSDPASWWYFAAIHGEYVLPSSALSSYPSWAFIPPPPSVPVAPLPPASPPAAFSSGQYWDQCQHFGWYFAPWHRGYLVAIEARLRQDIEEAGGPSAWALPYWNYFGANAEYNIPPAFTLKQLPAPPPSLRILPPPSNPLFVAARYGPDGTGAVYVPTQAGIAAHPSDPNFVHGTVTDACLQDSNFTTGGATGNGFGGDGPSLFLHFGSSMGDLESNPHNLVHVYVGGNQGLDGPEGLMSDPGLAALDPIFYLHHANIDRMWAGWNNPASRIHPAAGAPAPTAHPNPTQVGWTDGPTDRGFIMPLPSRPTPDTSTPWPFKPADVASLGLVQTDYTYEELPLIPFPPSPAALLAQRLTELGAGATAATLNEDTQIVTGTNAELMGSNRGSLPVNGTGTRTIIALSPQVREKVSETLNLASPSAPPDRVYLALENIRGTRDATVLNAYINLPEGANPKDHPNLLAGSVGLFGLRRASSRSGQHGGDGLSFTLDITGIVDQLHLSRALISDSIQVAIIPSRPLPEQADITIGRVSVYRRGR
jgi:tyrosinase